ncbi:MAG: hypothetical protein V4489_00770 [Chlamydiota bacterium]
MLGAIYLNTIHLNSRSAGLAWEDATQDKTHLITNALSKWQTHEFLVKTFERQEVLKKEESSISRVAIGIGRFMLGQPIFSGTKQREEYWVFKKDYPELSLSSSSKRNLSKVVEKEFKRLDKELVCLSGRRGDEEMVEWDMSKKDVSSVVLSITKTGRNVSYIAHEQAKLNINQEKFVGYSVIGTATCVGLWFLFAPKGEKQDFYLRGAYPSKEIFSV